MNLLGGDRHFFGGFAITFKQMFQPRVTVQYPEVKRPKPPRAHGRHVLNRYEDGMEKCIGCELCAAVCPADCIYVRGADNSPENPTSPGERYGFVYEINYLRCIHCDMCVEACPTEAITESKLFEFSFTSRADAIYTKAELVVDDDGMPQKMPWEDWREGDDLHTSGWMRATSPSGAAAYEGEAQWSAELGYGVRAAEGGQSDIRDDKKTGNISIRRVARNKIPVQFGGKAVNVAGLVFATATIPDALTFAIAAAIVIGGALGVVLLANPVHCALSLVMTLFGVAVLFVEQDAQFLAAVQIVVYSGAIVVLFLFVIMLLGVDKREQIFTDTFKGQRIISVILGLMVLAEVALLGSKHWTTGAKSVTAPITNSHGVASQSNVVEIGQSLFTTYLLPFEVTSALLVVAVIGAVVLARRNDTHSSDSTETHVDEVPPASDESDVIEEVGSR